MNKSNKVILLSAVKYPYGHASINRMNTYYKGFQNIGVDAELVLYSGTGNEKYIKDRSGFFNGVRYSFLPRCVCCKTKTTKFFSIINGLINIVPYLKKQRDSYSKVAVIYFSTSKLLVEYLYFICKINRIRLYLEVCEYPFVFLKKHDFNNILKRLYIRYKDSFFDGVIFETNRLESFYKSIFNNRINSVVINTTMEYEDILLERKHMPQDKHKESFIISYCGSISSEEKDGLSVIIKALSIAKNKLCNVNLHFIGRISNEQYKHQLDILIDTLGLQEYVLFTGELPRRQYVIEMLKSDILTVAKGEDSFFSGGLSSKVVEYLFSYIPCVLMPSDDYLLFLENHVDVHYCDGFSAEDLADGFEKVLSDVDYSNKLRENAFLKAFLLFDYKKLVGKLSFFIFFE